MKPAKWSNPELKIFPYQIGFTAPPKDFDAGPSDFLRIAPDSVGVHGRLLHVPDYAHQLAQCASNFHLLEEVAHCFSNAGVDAIGQVGTNWVHAGGTNADDIRAFCAEMTDKYETPFFMAGMCLVEACQALGISAVALNSGYFWPVWRDGVARFLKSAGLELLWYGNFVDQGLYDNQQMVNDKTWIFSEAECYESMRRVAKQAPDAEAILLNGMLNWRRADDDLPQRTVTLARRLEVEIGKPIIASDLALYWALFKSVGVAPLGEQGHLLSTLQG